MTTDNSQRTACINRHYHHRHATLGQLRGRHSAHCSSQPATQATQGFYFLADYHALIKCDDPARIQRSTLEIAASWIAAGLGPRGRDVLSAV